MKNPIINDPKFGDIVDFERVREVLDGIYERLSPEFNMLDAIEYGTDTFDDVTSYSVAGAASMLAWMMMLSAEEYELAEELKGNIFTLGWTEEHAGSDLLSVQTQATPLSDDPDEKQYHVKGRKWLINNSYHADYHMIVAKIDPDQDGPRSLSIFAVPRSSTKNWERLETHVLRNMVLTKFEIDGPGRLVGKAGHGLSIIQKMASASRYQCAYGGIRMTEKSIPAAIDHLSTKTIFKDQPINFSNVFRQMYNLVLQAGFLNFLFHRAVVFSTTSFLQFHGTMLKSFLLLRTNEVLSQNLLVTGSKGFLKESVIGRDAFDSFVLPVFDGHYTINTLMTAKHISRYLNATETGNAEERIQTLREKLFVGEPGNQVNRSIREVRNPKFFDYLDYWKQLDVPLDIDIEKLLNDIRTLLAELDETALPHNPEAKLSSDTEYKYKIGTLVHWLESLMAAAEFWQVMGEDDYLNAIVQQYNALVKAFNDIVSEGGLRTAFLTPCHYRPLPKIEDNEAYLRGLMAVRKKIEAMRNPVSGD